MKEFGGVGIILLAFIIGNIFYYIYRSLIYSTIILKLKDKFFKDQKYYTRSYFMSELGCVSSKDANNFFYFLRSRCNMKSLIKESSSVHLMYMIALILLLYVIHKICLAEYNLAVFFFLTAGVMLLSAFLTDRSIEKYDYNQVRAIPQDELNLHWKEYQTNQGNWFTERFKNIIFKTLKGDKTFWY